MPAIAICAPSRSLTPDDAVRVTALAAAFPGVKLHFHPQCFLSDGHFAGTDAQRLAALTDCANDPAFDAVWFARGGYGAARIAEQAMPLLGAAAQGKTYLGYSDAGTLLGGLYARAIGLPVHAPMPGDIRREDGAAAIARTLAWIAGDRSGEEPSRDQQPAAAFNLMTLAMLCGTSLMPDLTGHVIMVEEVAEYDYALDRLFFHVTAHLTGIAGLRLGRVSEVPENDIPFGQNAEQIARHWCRQRGIAYLGRADIGHDSSNKIVSFGLAVPRPAT